MVIEPVINLKRHEFCPNQAFMDEVINILDTHLFCNEAERLRKAYEWMASRLNEPNVSGKGMILPMDNPKVLLPQKSDNSKDGKIWAGHDLPVWLGCPCIADVKLMIVSQDPRRNDAEMGGCKIPSIGLSTPFGLHSLSWRSDVRTGIIHYAVCEALEHFKKEKKKACVYYTDMFKLRKAGKQDETTIDKQNTGSYITILQKEIGLFKPTKIILLGKEVAEMFDRNISPIPHGAEVVKLIHTSQRAWGAVTDPCIKQKYYLAGITSRIF